MQRQQCVLRALLARTDGRRVPSAVLQPPTARSQRQFQIRLTFWIDPRSMTIQ